MPKPSRLRQVIDQTRHEAQRLARETRQNPTSVNVAARHNVVLASNAGEPGASETAVAVQSTAINQGRRSE